MKFFSLGLALSTLGLMTTAGCSAPADSSNPASNGSAANGQTDRVALAPTSDAAPTVAPSASRPAPSKALASKTAPAKPKPTAKTTATTASKSTKGKSAKNVRPDPAYRVEDPAAKYGGQAPAALLKALSDVRVPPPPTDYDLPAKPRVVLQTSKGPITVELNTKEAPLQVKSFVYLAKLHFFDGTKFHRHADLTGDGKGFIIQGGDPLTKDPTLTEAYGQGGPGYEIPREKNSLKHDALVIAAARSSDPDSAGSQFYITQGPVYFLDEGDGYTVFGKVVDGKAAALKLSQDDTLQSAKVK